MKYESKTIDFRSIKEMPPDQRPRERMLASGSLGLSDIELMCIVLGSGSPQRPVQDVAEDVISVISRQGSTELEVDDFSEIAGLGSAKVARVCAALELGRRFSPSKRRQMKDPATIYNEIRHYGGMKQEHFIVVMLNGAHELLGLNVVTIGLVNRTLVHPREVFSDPIKERATAIVLAHNHPSGNLEPSPDDLDVTARIRKAGQLLGIEVLDHIIFSLDGYRSLMESGELF